MEVFFLYVMLPLAGATVIALRVIASAVKLRRRQVIDWSASEMFATLVVAWVISGLAAYIYYFTLFYLLAV